jgi:hypothetical protein
MYTSFFPPEKKKKSQTKVIVVVAYKYLADIQRGSTPKIQEICRQNTND